MHPEKPLLVFRAMRNPRTGQIIRAAMCGSALMIAAIAAFAPAIFGRDNGIVTPVLLAVAGVDLVLAFILPPVIEKQSAEAEYRFFHDRLEIYSRLQGPLPQLAYDNIKTVEEQKGDNANLTAIRITTQEAHGIPAFGQGSSLILSSLAAADAPLDKIKEVVEKSRQQ